MFNNQVMAVHEQSAGLSIFSQKFKRTFYETLNLGHKFLASKHYPHRVFSIQDIKHLGWAILISLDIDVPHLQIAPLVGNLEVENSHSLFLISSIQLSMLSISLIALMQCAFYVTLFQDSWDVNLWLKKKNSFYKCSCAVTKV